MFSILMLSPSFIIANMLCKNFYFQLLTIKLRYSRLPEPAARLRRTALPLGAIASQIQLRPCQDRSRSAPLSTSFIFYTLSSGSTAVLWLSLSYCNRKNDTLA